MDIEQCIRSRRDTRHFCSTPVPDYVVQKALEAAHHAPSVGLSEPWRFVLVRSKERRAQIFDNFERCRQQAEDRLAKTPERQRLHASLKLEAILSAPVGLAVFCCEPKPEQYILGASTETRTLEWSVACAIQNLWLSLTAQGYGAGWVSILDFKALKQILATPDHWRPLAYLCIGKPATDYDGQPMLQQLGWRQQRPQPIVLSR